MKDLSFQPRTIWMLVGAILGVLFGLFLSNVALWFAFAGTLFLNALTLTVFPLIMVTVIVGMVTLGDYRKLGRISGKTFGLFALSSGVAVLIGATLALLIGPGNGLSQLNASPLSNALMPSSLGSVSGFLETLLPSNLIEATAGGYYLGLIIISILLGAVLSTLSNKIRSVVTLVRGLQDIMHRLVALLLMVAPVGIFFLTASVVASNRDTLFDSASGLAKLSMVVLLGLALQLFVILPLLLAAFARKNPIAYFRNLWPAMLTGLTTGSSVAAYPVTYENVIEANAVDSRAGSLVLPLSLSLHNCGSALFLSVAAIFVIQAFSIPITFWLLAKVLVAALFVSLGVSGIPSGALFGLAAVGSFAGFPREAFMVFTLLLAIDWLLDRVRTAVNVAGDGITAAVIAESFEFKTVGRKALRAESSRPREPRPGYRGRTGSADKPAGRRDRSTDPRRGSTRPDKPADGKDDRRRRSSERPPRDANRSQRPDSRPDQPDRRSVPPVAAKESPPEVNPRPQQISRSDEAPRPERTEDKSRNDRPRERRGRDSDRSRRRSERSPRTERAKPAASPDESSDTAPTPKPQPPVERKSPAETGNVAAVPISPDTIKRELSAVQAHLKDRPERQPVEVKEESPRETRRPIEPSEAKPEAPTSSPEVARAPRPEPTPVEPVRERPAPVSSASDAPSSEAARDKASAKPDESTEAKSFGRGKHRKTPLKSKPSKSPSEATPEKESSDPKYATEAISFGRGKRKKN